MVREREAPRNPLMPSQARISTSMLGEEKVPIEIPSSPLAKQNGPSQVLSPQPEFGRPTALNNNASPLAKMTARVPETKILRRSGDKNHSNLFSTRYHKPPTGAENPLSNIGRDAPKLPQQQSRDSSTSTSSNAYNVTAGDYSMSNRADPSRPAPPQRPQGALNIPVPSNAAPTWRPAPVPTFSSNSSTNPHIRPADNFVDLTQHAVRPAAEDGFNDGYVFGSDRFGTADPMTYLDSKQADENIKALLEGAMDEEDDKPRTRRKKQELQKKVDDLSKKMQGVDVKEDTEEPEQDDEEDDGTREGLKIKLLPHQIDGVEWMTNKELGTKKVKGVLPYGGILADDMGLGKTIQSIALILGNPYPSEEELKSSKRKFRTTPDKATLVVAPLALIKQWEAEIKDRVEEDHALKVKVHHGPQRTKSFKDLRKYDVVITTYQTLSSEHVENSGSEKTALFGVNWYRVILDEAHSVKNRNAKSTKAACALDAEYRWCLTGTPMQNNLDELQSLIHFLRIKPYDHLDTWREQITKPMNNGRGGLSIRRLRAFLSAFMKRRTKDVLKQDGALKAGANGAVKSNTGFKIVKRTVENVEAEFNEHEKAFYNRLEARTDKSLELMMAGSQTSYASVLVLLMRLRQACNHPQLLGADLSKEQDALTGSRTPGRKGSKVDDMDDIAAMLGGLSVETKRCDVCQIELGKSAVEEGLVRCEECEEDLKLAERAARKPRTKEKKIVKKERKINRRVVVDSDDEEDSVVASHQSETENEEEEEDSAEEEEEEESGSDEDFSAQGLPPSPTSSTKIRHLLKILKHDSHTHKYIVFSFFTSMLDLIEPFLKRHRLKFVRYDGAMRNDAREASLEQLKTKPDVRILLCSLRAGSLGLNLTAASRVVILEPFWNPFVEEQAIDRVHRLNQPQDVIVHKLTIKDSVESRILELQDKKRELAKATIEGQKGTGAGKLSMQEMLKLFKHDAESDPNLDRLGMKDGRSLLDRDSQSTAARSQPVYVEQEARRPDSRVSKAEKRPDHPAFGRRW